MNVRNVFAKDVSCMAIAEVGRFAVSTDVDCERKSQEFTAMLMLTFEIDCDLVNIYPFLEGNNQVAIYHVIRSSMQSYLVPRPSLKGE